MRNGSSHFERCESKRSSGRTKVAEVADGPCGGPPKCLRAHLCTKGRSASMSGHGSLPPPDKTVRAGNLRSSNPSFKIGRFGHMLPAWLQRPPAVPDAALDALAETMRDSRPGGQGNNGNIPAGYT